MKALSLFTGIGGLDIAAEWCGIEPVAFCEIEPYAQKVLRLRWPLNPFIEDVRDATKEAEAIGGQSVDVVFGGFPCQDLSTAGKQAGLEGGRSGLWFEMLRVVEEFRPRFVVAENVRGAINLALDTVHAGLETAGYEVGTILVSASAFGAPHKRERVFIVGVWRDVADAFKSGLEGGEWAGTFREEGETTLRATAERGGSIWPTPSVCGNHNRKGASKNSGDGLATAVHHWGGNLWRTPQASDGSHGGPNARDNSGNPHLSSQACQEDAKLSPTPRGVGLSGGAGHLDMPRNSLGVDEARSLSAGNGGKLNADWVEQLQGFPDGWTDVECAEPNPWAGWPALMGLPQYPYEHPRTIKRQSHRAARLKALGNAVVPQQAYPIFQAVAIMGRIAKEAEA